MADDIIIAASTVEEHDKILHEVLQRAVEQNAKLNSTNYNYVSKKSSTLEQSSYMKA